MNVVVTVGSPASDGRVRPADNTVNAADSDSSLWNMFPLISSDGIIVTNLASLELLLIFSHSQWHDRLYIPRTKMLDTFFKKKKEKNIFSLVFILPWNIQ